MVNLLDDFHNILTVHLPSNLKLSVATHMTSSLVDIHLTVPAVTLPANKGMQHSAVKVSRGGEEKTCRGGIVSQYIHQLLRDNKAQMNSTYMEKQGETLHKVTARDIQQQLKELR